MNQKTDMLVKISGYVVCKSLTTLNGVPVCHVKPIGLSNRTPIEPFPDNNVYHKDVILLFSETHIA